MRIDQQIDEAVENLMLAQGAWPGARIYDRLEHAIGDGMAVLKPTTHYSSVLAEAVFNMRAAMTASETKGKRPDDLPNVPALEELGRTHYADPTGELAVKVNAARTQHRDLLRAVNVYCAAAHRCACPDPQWRDADTAAAKGYFIHDLALRWLPRPATAKERAETERANDPDAKGCVSCARTDVAKGVKRWEPIARGDLCWWCYDWKRKTGTAPPLEKLVAHHDGKRVMVDA